MVDTRDSESRAHLERAGSTPVEATYMDIYEEFDKKLAELRALLSVIFERVDQYLQKISRDGT